MRDLCHYCTPKGKLPEFTQYGQTITGIMVLSFEDKEAKMDPVTLAIVTSLANLSQTAIQDAYMAFKAALQKKYGIKSELLESVNKLEQKPDSKARQSVLQEEVANAKADQDPKLLQIANDLLEKIKELPGAKINISQDLNIRGDRNIVTGQGDVTINE
jgi:hypothetical protein